ncbi:MAG TPA: flagellar hook-length control protein FliK, partial [Phenylobacterium sp.]
RPVTATAKAAGPDVEAVETAAAGPAKTAPDNPDAAATGETRSAAAQSAAPLAHAAHEVRGSPETVANLAAQIVKKLEAKSTRFDVELNPAGLGKVNVRVEIGAQGAITAAMSFDNPQAAAELRSRATELQRALEQAGFTLSGAMSFDVAQDRGQQGQAWQQAQQDGGEHGRAFRGHAFQSALDTAGDAANAAVNGALRLRRGVSAGVDVRI